MRRRGLAVLGVALLAGACGYKQSPITSVDEPLPPAAQRLTLEQIQQRIVAGAARRNWRVTPVRPGELFAVQSNDKMSATVNITFDRQRYQITYRDSTGLRAGDGVIHAHYNFWVRNLKADIDASLAGA